MTEKNSPPPDHMQELSLLFSRSRESGALRRGLKRSAIAHAALGILLLLWALIWRGEPVVYKPTLRVDLVGLPDLVKEKGKDLSLDELSKELDKPKPKMKEPEPEPKPTESDMALKKKEKEKPKDKKHDLKSAIDRIRALEKIEDQVKGAKKKEFKGNVVSKGSDEAGEVGESNMGEFVDAVRAKLRANWDLPVWLSKQNFSARIVIFLDSTGYLKSAILAKSSGNDQYDDFALKTVRKSQPFPKPPREILDNGLTLLFPL